MSDHPCWHHTCCENYRGQCYGGGCNLNPKPFGEPDWDDRDDEEDGEEEDNEEEEGFR